MISSLHGRLIMTITLMNTVEAKEQFTDIINRVAHSKERIILTRRGKEIAAIIPLEDLEILQHTQDKHDLHSAIDALKEARSSGTITLNQLEDELGT
jgi:prevent-host-death family protein